MLRRLPLGAGLCLLALTVVSCAKRTDEAVTRTDSVTINGPGNAGGTTGGTANGGNSTASNTEDESGPGGTSMLPGGGMTSPQSPIDPKNPQIVQLPPLAPGQKPPMPFPQQAAPAPSTAPVGSATLLPAAVLAQFHPKHPEWVLNGRINNKDVQGIHESITVLKNVRDTSHTIRSTIIDQDERTAHTLIMQMSALRQNGSITQYPEGEAVTAYFVQIGNTVGARAYIPSKKVATLTLIVGDHRLIQLRENQAENTDNLLDVARHIDLTKFESMH